MKKPIILMLLIKLNFILFIFVTIPVHAQHFHHSWEGQQPFSPMNIFIIEAKLNEVDLTANDEIGIFDGEQCVGAGTITEALTSTNFLEIVASKDDGISGLGFTEGNEIIVKIWIASLSQEYTVTGDELQYYNLETEAPIDPVPFAGLGTAAIGIKATEQEKLIYLVKKIPDNVPLPTIDGNINESFWATIDEDSLVFGGMPLSWGTDWANWDDNLVTWKAVWSDVTNKLYIAVTVKDDVRGLFDQSDPAGPSFTPLEDECLMFFTDGDNSGGFYEASYTQTQEWMVTGENKVILDDYPNANQHAIYTGNDLITAVSWGTNGNWSCEAEFRIYDSLPTIPKTLSVGDTIGWDIWYNDSDNETYQNGYYLTDHQTGWLYSGAANSDASFLGGLVLDENFKNITVTSPNGGESWQVNTPQSITWTSSGVPENVKIEISTDAGVTWSILNSSTINNGVFSWTPSDAYISNNCLIKISSTTNDLLFDQSNNIFSIVSTTEVNLSIDTDLTGPEGGTVIIPINCSDVTGLSVFSADLTISYDATVLEVIDVSISGTLAESSGWNTPSINVINGQISIGMAGSIPLSGAGKLVNIICNIIGSSGDTTPLHFVYASLNEGDPPSNTDDGFFEVISYYFNIQGRLSYYSNQNEPVNNASVTLIGLTTQSVISDVAGIYSFSDLEFGNYTVTPTKSNDVKNALSSYDASFILRFAVNIITLTPYQKIAADVSGNGAVTAYDASFILRYTVGAVDSFPVGADWAFVPHEYPIDDNNWSTSPRSRNYTPLESDQLDQNFIGILYGDVSGNWSVSNVSVSSGNVKLRIDHLQPTNDGKWLLPLEIDFPEDAYSGSISIIFNNPDLEFVSSSTDNTSSKDIILVAHAFSEGIKLAFASAKTLKDHKLKINLLFDELNSVILSTTDFDIADVFIDDKATIITVVNNQSHNQLPVDWHLGQNRPNPFNPETSISYQVPKLSHVTIEVFNLLGQRLKTLVDEEKNAGIYQTIWNGLDKQRLPAGCGIYIYKMQAGNYRAIKKMLLVR